MPTYHRVDSKRRPIPTQFALPHDSIKEGVFVEADGTELVVMCSGKMPSGFWPEGRDMDKERKPARVHLTTRRT